MNSHAAGIYSEYPLTMEISGSNTVTGAIGDMEKSGNTNKYYGASYGIYAAGLVISGEGELDVAGVDVSGSSYGIYSNGDVIINGGKITANAGETVNISSNWNFWSVGIYINGGLTVNDGEIEANAKRATRRSAGVYVAAPPASASAVALMSLHNTAAEMEDKINPEGRALENTVAMFYSGSQTGGSSGGGSINDGVATPSAVGGGICINGGSLEANGAQGKASGRISAYSNGIYAQGEITVHAGTMIGKGGDGSTTSEGIYSPSNITIHGGTVTGTGGSSAEDQNRGIFSNKVLTITDGVVTGTAGSATADFSEGIGGYDGINISGGIIEAIGGDESLVSIGLYSDWDLTISGDAHITATASSARVYSYGTWCWRNFHMSGEAFLQSVAGETTSESTSSRPRRSIGFYMSDSYYESDPPYVDDTFVLTGGTFEAWCTTSAETTSVENYAFKMYDVVDNAVVFSDRNQTNEKWYYWTLDADGASENENKSAERPYIHDDAEENYKSTYLLIAPLIDTHEVTFNSMGGSEVDPNPVEVEDGETVAEPDDPTREGHTFAGWYTSTDNGVTLDEAYDFTTPVTESFTLYAKWEAVETEDPDDPEPGDDDGETPDRPSGPSYGKVTLTKVDAEDNDTVLSGVEFALYKESGRLIDVYSTDSDGEITVGGLRPGDYYWVELSPAVGYVLDDTEHAFEIKAHRHTKMTVENERSAVPGYFTDDHYAYIVGYDDGLVHPEWNVTRAEVAAIFFRLLDKETRAAYLSEENHFSDVNEGDWFHTSVSTMAAMGILSGYPDGKFHPSANITRAEFAAIAARFEERGNTTDGNFEDIYGHWAMKEINISANNGWVLGYEDGTFRPDQKITRAEAMAMVNRVLQRIPQDHTDLISGMKMWPDNANMAKWYYLTVQEATNSHDYGRKTSGYEFWMKLNESPNWNEFL